MFGKTKAKNDSATNQFLYIGERLVFYDLSEGSYQEVDEFVKQGYKILAGYGGMYHRLVLEKPVNNEATG